MQKAQKDAGSAALKNAKSIVRDQLGDTTGTGNILFVDSVNESLVQGFFAANKENPLSPGAMSKLKSVGGGVTQYDTSIIVLGAVTTAVAVQNNTLHEIGHQLRFRDEQGGKGVMRGSNPGNEATVRKFTPGNIMVFEIKRARAAGQR